VAAPAGAECSHERGCGAPKRRWPVYDASWTGEDMVAVRAKEHNCTLDKGIHHSPKHMAQARAHRALHGAWPPFTVHEVLCSMEGETWDAFVRRVIRAERRELDTLGEARQLGILNLLWAVRSAAAFSMSTALSARWLAACCFC
jgi:hypothetical protein